VTARSLLLWAAAIWATSAGAHHSYSNIYDTSKSVTLEAIVTQFQFVHPHPYLLLNVGDDQVSWRAEMDNRFELEDIGVTAQTFKTGDRVVVSGSPGRTEKRTLYMWRLERPSDGLQYEQIGSTPYLRPHQGAGL
jgi:hypothetical protein